MKPSLHAMNKTELYDSGNTAPQLYDSGNTAPQDARLSSISIVFPAFNEELNIAKAVDFCYPAFSSYFKDIEVIVVDDGSSDNTKAVLEQLIPARKGLRAVYHRKNQGYGAAVRSGLYSATKDYVFFTDADLQFDLNEIGKLIPFIGSSDIVIGYRARRADPLVRKVNAWGWNMVVRLTLGLKVRDIDCAFKLFRRNVFEVVDLKAVGAMINTELLSLMVKNKMVIKEVPVSHFPRVAGTQTGANIKVILKAFKELWLMRKRIKNPESTEELHSAYEK